MSLVVQSLLEIDRIKGVNFLDITLTSSPDIVWCIQLRKSYKKFPGIK